MILPCRASSHDVAQDRQPGGNAANPSRLRLAPWRLDQSVVVYPEITAGKPLGAKHVVRYLPNKPGFFSGRGMEGWGVQSRPLRFPLIDTAIFTPPPSARERKGFLVYSRRYRPNVDRFPDWIDAWTLVAHE